MSHRVCQRRTFFLTWVLIALSLSGCVDTLLPGSDSGPSGTAARAPGIPENLAAIPGDEQVRLTWKAPSGLATGETAPGSEQIYKHQAWVVNDTLRIYADTSRSCTAFAPDTTCTISGLTNGTSYRFVVVAYNKAAAGTTCSNHDSPGSFNSVNVAGRSCAGNWVTAVPNGRILKVPGAPRSVQAQADDAKARVSWSAPDSDGGTPVTGYLVTAVSDTLKQCKTAGALSCTVTGLTNGASYTFVVQATNKVGTGSEWAASPPVIPAAVPAAPTGVTAVGGHAEAKISWNASPSPAGAPVLGYVAFALSDTTKRCATFGALTCTIASLSNSTPYSFVVRAENRIGLSSLSAPSATVTPFAPAPWTGRTSGTTNHLYSVAYSGGTFVIVGDSGTVLTSPNGTNWVTRNPVVSIALRAVDGNGSGWIAVGDSGTILSSPTGSTWTSRRSSGANLRGVAYAGTQWIAVGDSGAILTSSDGVSWTSRVSGLTDTLRAVAWSGSVATVVGASGKVLTSSDGITWTSRNPGTNVGLNGVAWADSVFAVVGGTTASKVLTSADGITWTARPSDATSTPLNGVAWTGNQLLAVGGGGSIFGAADPVETTQRLTTLFGTLNAAAGMPTQWVAVGDEGVIFTSP